MATVKTLRRLRITRGIRKKISGTGVKPRLAVFRSNAGIYVQLIDDLSGKTLASASTQELKSEKGTKVEISKKVGMSIAKKAQVRQSLKKRKQPESQMSFSTEVVIYIMVE